MTDITEKLGTLYHPKAALVFYEANEQNADGYVEYFDLDRNGHPINAHPLTVREAQALSKTLDTKTEDKNAFLKPAGIIANNILYIDASAKGSVIWFTKQTKRKLYFKESLEIPDGLACIPALLWIASKEELYIYALNADRRPAGKTKLYHAPFFNIYANGNVCMGTVDVNIKKSASLEEFTGAWENYFFNSYFSHLLQGHNPIHGNCVTLWKDLVTIGGAFPKEVLKETGSTIENLFQ